MTSILDRFSASLGSVEERNDRTRTFVLEYLREYRTGAILFRNDLERQVRRGDLTVKAARAQIAEQLDLLRLRFQTEHQNPYVGHPRVFIDRVVEACNALKKAKDNLSLEGLQRETNRLLRLSLIEAQIASREEEFANRTFNPDPGSAYVDLIAFHENAELAGDEPALEWARRQLERLRPALHVESQKQIDKTCVRPDVVNPRIVASHIDSLRTADEDVVSQFVYAALEIRDASSCVAAFLRARSAPDAAAKRWVRDVLNGLGAFPATALQTIREIEVALREEASAVIQEETAAGLLTVTKSCTLNEEEAKPEPVPTKINYPVNHPLLPELRRFLSEIDALKARITRLETLLREAEIPHEDRECDCCHSVFVSRYPDNDLCGDCRYGCDPARDQHGAYCPRHKQTRQHNTTTVTGNYC